MPALREHCVDRVRRRGELVEHAAQAPAAKVLAHFPQRAPREPAPGERPVVQHGSVVALDARRHAQRNDAPVDGELPAARLVAVAAEGQAFVLREIVRRARHPASRQVVGAGDDEAPVLRQVHADEARVVERADAHRDVDVLVDDVRDAVGEFEGDRHLRMRFEERRHERSDVHATEAGRGGDAQVPARLDSAERYRRLCVVQVAQQSLAVFEEGAALEGERDAPRGSHEQAHAQARFERVDATTDHGRRHAFGARGRAQAALRGDRDEGLDLAESRHCGPIRLQRLDYCKKVKAEPIPIDF